MSAAIQKIKLSRLCAIAYESALISFAGLLLFGLLSGTGTYHATVDRTLDRSHFEFTAPLGAEISAGESLDVFRFHDGWRSTIGRAVVTGTEGSRITASFDPRGFRWPLGRHARIIGGEGNTVTIEAGRAFGLLPGNELVVFMGREKVGRIRLTEVGLSASTATVLESSRPYLQGLTASEYTVATQITGHAHAWLQLAAVLCCCLLIASHLLLWARLGQSPFLFYSEKVQAAFQRLWSGGTRFAALLGLGVLFVWFLVKFSLLAADYLAMQLVRLLFTCTGDCPMPAFRPFLEAHILWLYLAAYALYCAFLWRRNSSPVLAFWNSFAFRGWLTPIQNPLLRNALIWALQLVIAYAFASSLFSFLAGNLNAALPLAWPNCPVPVQGQVSLNSWPELSLYFSTLSGVVGYVLTTPPRFASVESFFLVLRYALWSLTIVGCLVGYGHSIVSYLWGKRIRNLDFTAMGWITNAWCYGPLLGVVVWQMVPGFIGPDPLYADGPLLYFNFIVECCLNILYTLSIWNLGTMFGVMTDKGVRTSGFYRVVRHPSYTLEAMMFVSLEMRALSGPAQWASILLYFFIYYVRAEREDVFMSKSNPDYAPYKARTPWKFIPGVY